MLVRVILPLSMPGIAVTVIPGFMFCWNAFNYSLMLAGRQTFPVTVGAIQFISYEQVLWGQMAAATIVAALPQLILSLMVQYIVRGLTVGGGAMSAVMNPKAELTPAEAGFPAAGRLYGTRERRIRRAGRGR